ncbi:MAG: phosphomethylpyrimidine synthase ThiC, partial [Planctomycetes bacterium]|nr:phosphomethylpyrimidine synthase ThiC [Planctomycetota bacterium]
MTQLQAARSGRITPQMRRVAERENVTAAFIREKVAAGHLVIPANRRHLAGGQENLPDTFSNVRLDPMGIGRALTVKINANIGASPVSSGTDEEGGKL